MTIVPVEPPLDDGKRRPPAEGGEANWCGSALVSDDLPQNAQMPDAQERQPTPSQQHALRWEALDERMISLIGYPLAHVPYMESVRAFSQEMIDLVRQDPELAVFRVVRHYKVQLEQYGALHSLQTAVLCILIALRRDWPATQRLQLCCAALTMNLSIAELQSELALQETPLRDDQRQSIQEHPANTTKLLRDLGVDDKAWLQAVMEHHEQSDGKGYPLGLREVSLLGDALRTADVFVAKVSPRASRSAVLTPQAVEQIFKQRSAGYIGATIIRELGVYPPGSLVKLSTGEVAMVLRRTAEPTAPEVALLSDPLEAPRDAPLGCFTGDHMSRRVVGACWNEALAARFSAYELFGA